MVSRGAEWCPVGKFGNITGGLSESAACMDCFAGQYCPGVDVIKPCSAGRYGNVPGKGTLLDACMFACIAGKYGVVRGATSSDIGCGLVGSWAEFVKEKPGEFERRDLRG